MRLRAPADLDALVRSLTHWRNTRQVKGIGNRDLDAAIKYLQEYRELCIEGREIERELSRNRQSRTEPGYVRH